MALIGLDAVRALPVLLGGLKHNQARVRKAALEALAILGRMVEKAVPHVRPLIGGDPDAVVRAAAITALARIVPWARRTQDYLTPVGLRDEAEEVGLAAVFSLGILYFDAGAAPGPGPGRGPGRVIRHAPEGDRDAREAGESAAVAIPELIQSLWNEAAWVRVAAAAALEYLGLIARPRFLPCASSSGMIPTPPSASEPASQRRGRADHGGSMCQGDRR